MNEQQVKQRFGIIGNDRGLNRAIRTAIQVAPTNISVLITGESGTGKEVMPQIVHQLSARKHGQYIAVNCGAIPEGTIDSELFGHEKGSFTGAHEKRKGYFEVADGGTIFLDEVAELPLETQVRLLRVLETGEFFKVGSSKVIKTDVRIVAATNINVPKLIREGKFREDLYYRLNTVPIKLPPLRERKEDIHLLFRKFVNDFTEQYRMPGIRLNEQAKGVLEGYHWPGNIRQLRNLTEQISVLEEERSVSAQTLIAYLPVETVNSLPALVTDQQQKEALSDREILYKVLFDMRNDINDLKSLVLDILEERDTDTVFSESKASIVQKLHREVHAIRDHENGTFQVSPTPVQAPSIQPNITYQAPQFVEHEEVEESLSLAEREKDLIIKALKKHKNKRKYAAEELGISERTLYRKIKEYNI